MKKPKQIEQKKQEQNGEQKREKQTEELLDCRCHHCGFNKNNQGGCKECEECHSPPFKVKESCQRCFDCEFKPNNLRWADDALKQAEEQSKKKIEGMFKQFAKRMVEEEKQPEITYLG